MIDAAQLQFALYDEGDTPTEPTPETPPPPEDHNQNTPQDLLNRIDSLYGGKKAAEDSVSQLQQRLLATHEQNLALQEQIKALSTNKQDLPPAGDETSTTPQPDIRKVIQEELGKYREEQQKQQRAAALQQAHASAFERARQMFPDFANTQSALHQAAAQVWERNPALRSDPNGPLNAALIAAGLMGQRSPDQSVEQRKVAASGVTQPSTGPLTTPSVNEKKLADLQTRFEAVKGRMVNNQTTQDWLEYRNLQRQISELQKG